MNKHILTVLLVMLMMLSFSACNKQDEVKTESMEMSAATTEATTIPTYPGTVYTPDGNDGNLDEISETDVKQNHETTAPTGSETVTETTISVLEPEETMPEETNPVVTEALSDYERYIAMSGPEQQAFMESFGSIPEFFEWYNNAKAEYESANPAIYITGDEIDAEDIKQN